MCVCACVRACVCVCVCAWDIRQLMQLAALLLVSGLEFLMLHSEPLLLQHDLLVQTGRKDTASCLYEATDWKMMFEWPLPKYKYCFLYNGSYHCVYSYMFPCCCPFMSNGTMTEGDEMKSYSCSSVMSFSLLSSSSLRLLICFWWASRWEWICFSTASWTHTNAHNSWFDILN